MLALGLVLFVIALFIVGGGLGGNASVKWAARNRQRAAQAVYEAGVIPIEPGKGRLIVESSRSPLSVMPVLPTPYMRVDDREYPSEWGRTVIDLRPGPHQLHVHLGDLRGAVARDVWIIPGQATVMYYRAPLMSFSVGALGAVPQSTPDRFLFIGIGILVSLAQFVAILLLDSIDLGS